MRITKRKSTDTPTSTRLEQNGKSLRADDTAVTITHENMMCIPVNRLHKRPEPDGADDKKDQLLYEVVLETLDGLTVYNVCADEIEAGPLE